MDLHAQLLGVMQNLSINTHNVTSETRLKDDLGMDSTELVELAVMLEKHLSLSIDDAMLGKLTTVGEIEQFLESLSLQYP